MEYYFCIIFYILSIYQKNTSQHNLDIANWGVIYHTTGWKSACLKAFIASLIYIFCIKAVPILYRRWINTFLYINSILSKKVYFFFINLIIWFNMFYICTIDCIYYLQICYSLSYYSFKWVAHTYFKFSLDTFNEYCFGIL